MTAVDGHGWDRKTGMRCEESGLLTCAAAWW